MLSPNEADEVLAGLRYAADEVRRSLVRDPAAQSYLDRLAALTVRHAAKNNLPQDLRYATWLGDDTYLRFISPGAAPLHSELGPEMFLHSPTRIADGMGVLWLARQQPVPRFPMRFADAVASAGMEAHASHRRRAVVLILGEDPDDASRHSVAAVREYLRQLHVPLLVWSFASAGTSGETPGSEWGEVRALGFPDNAAKVPGSFQDALKALRTVLRSQRIVWLEGRHLPQAIELAPDADKVRFAGG